MRPSMPKAYPLYPELVLALAKMPFGSFPARIPPSNEASANSLEVAFQNFAFKNFSYGIGN